MMSDVENTPTSLYLMILKDAGVFKIGKANDVYERSLTLSKYWGEVDYDESYELRTTMKSVFKIEKALHLLLESHSAKFDEGDGKTEMFQLTAVDLALDYLNLYSASETTPLTLTKGIPQRLSVMPENITYSLTKYPNRANGVASIKPILDTAELYEEPYNYRHGYACYLYNPSVPPDITTLNANLSKVKNVIGLSKTAIFMLEAMYKEIDEFCERDHIGLSHHYFNEHGISVRDYRKGIAELVDNGLIYLYCARGVYFLNVIKLFKGDKASLVKAKMRRLSNNLTKQNLICNEIQQTTLSI